MALSQPLPLAAEASPGTAERLPALRALVEDLDGDQLRWLSGYLAGLADAGTDAAGSAPAVSPVVGTVLYASQTGNGRRVAEAVGERFADRGLNCRSLEDYRVEELKHERQVLFVVSTHGEGDPPDTAVPFFERLASRRAPRLEGLRYAILALGDSSYEHFCAVGQRLDARLAELGAQRVLDRVDCDVEFEGPAGEWIDALGETLDFDKRDNVVTMARTPGAPDHERPAITIGRDQPLEAEVLEVQRITGRGSTSDTFHVELATPGLSYAPGDSLGIWHHNPEAIVAPVLSRLGLHGDESVEIGDRTLSLGAALERHRELTLLSRPVLERYASATGQPELARSFAARPRDEQARLLGRWQLLDLLDFESAPLSAQALVDLLAPLRPRLYSIASALSGEEVHLTVSRVVYGSQRLSLPEGRAGDLAASERAHSGGERLGAASNCLVGLAPGDALRVYCEPNRAFRLPADPATPILMIGAGTGVAPFRAFLEARAGASGAGPAWLIFGHRNFRTDFLYQIEWQRRLAAGELTRLDLAFSRDPGAPHRYVQDALGAAGGAVRAHVEAGGHIYVCGSIAMGQAVDTTLAALDGGPESDDEDRSLLATLRSEGRLHRDVY